MTKVMIVAPEQQVAGHLGPLCIACGNTKRFWLHTPTGESLFELTDLPPGEVRVVACGRCRSRNSIVVAHVD